MYDQCWSWPLSWSLVFTIFHYKLYFSPTAHHCYYSSCPGHHRYRRWASKWGTGVLSQGGSSAILQVIFKHVLIRTWIWTFNLWWMIHMIMWISYDMFQEEDTTSLHVLQTMGTHLWKEEGVEEVERWGFRISGRRRRCSKLGNIERGRGGGKEEEKKLPSTCDTPVVTWSRSTLSYCHYLADNKRYLIRLFFCTMLHFVWGHHFLKIFHKIKFSEGGRVSLKQYKRSRR